MVWIKLCFCQKMENRPPISSPIHLLLKSEGVDGNGPCHIFKNIIFKKPKPCNLCHQPILNQGSKCRVCKYICHKVCEGKNYQNQSLRYGKLNWLKDTYGVNRKESQTHKQKDRSLQKDNNNNTTISNYNPNGMDLSYVTERIISLWLPSTGSTSSYQKGHQMCSRMLKSKYQNNFMIFNLSEPRRFFRQEYEHVKEVGWCPRLAPPLERICIICKDIDFWLSTNKDHIVVLYARDNKDQIAVIIAAFMNYSKICGSSNQALDQFSMQRFLDENIGRLILPSNIRYIEYFSGLLSGSIRVNAAPVYLSHVTIFGIPRFQNDLVTSGCRAFLKIYEGRNAIYTSGIYTIEEGSKQCTISVIDKDGNNLRLRGDILIKCYHRNQEFGKSGRDLRTGRECIFACQFHTCTLTDSTIVFNRSELDFASVDPRFPIDANVELNLSCNKQKFVQSKNNSDVIIDDPVTFYDSLENVYDMDDEYIFDTDDISHTYGPLDGSIYATVAKKSTLLSGMVSSPLTVSMDSGISSAGNNQQNHQTITTYSSSPQSSPLTQDDQHRELDELLNDMLLNVENIPDIKTRKHDLDLLPYHARDDSKPFSYTATSKYDFRNRDELLNPIFVRKLPETPVIKTTNNSNSIKNTQKVNYNDKDNDVFENSLSGTIMHNNLNDFSKEKCDKSSLNVTKNGNITPYLENNYNHFKINSIPQCNNNSTLSSESNNQLSWLQKQQIKLKEKRDILCQNENHFQKLSLINELKNVQQKQSRNQLSGGTQNSDDEKTTENDNNIDDESDNSSSNNGANANYDNDFSRPLHIYTSKNQSKNDKYVENLSSGLDSVDSGLLSMVEQEQSRNLNSKVNDMLSMSYNESYTSSLCTSPLTNEQDIISVSSTRPQTPAFPVNQKNSYHGGHVHFQLPSNGKLPPRSPLLQRRDLSVMTQQENDIDQSQVSSNFSFSPKQSSSPIYLNHAFRDRSESINSMREHLHEIPAYHIKFVRDTLKYWYKPSISRDQAINLLKNRPPGTFIVRDSNSFVGAFGLALKVSSIPANVRNQKYKQDHNDDEYIRHFLIEPTAQGVRLKGCLNEPVFSSLSALIYQHSITKLALPQLLIIPEIDLESNHNLNTNSALFLYGAACNVLYIFSIEMESLTGPEAIKKAIIEVFSMKTLPQAIIVHLKVSEQGITLTDNDRKQFFRKHYPLSSVSYSGMDPGDHRWHVTCKENGIPENSNRCFGFVAKKICSSGENECHIFAELEPEQPAIAIVNFINKLLTVNK